MVSLPQWEIKIRAAREKKKQMAKFRFTMTQRYNIIRIFSLMFQNSHHFRRTKWKMQLFNNNNKIIEFVEEKKKRLHTIHLHYIITIQLDAYS